MNEIDMTGENLNQIIDSIFSDDEKSALREYCAKNKLSGLMTFDPIFDPNRILCQTLSEKWITLKANFLIKISSELAVKKVLLSALRNRYTFHFSDKPSDYYTAKRCRCYTETDTDGHCNGTQRGLFYSCMRYPKCKHNGFFDIYDSNEHCHILVVRCKHCGNMVARCLTWDAKLCEDGASQKTYDVIYDSSPAAMLFVECLFNSGELGDYKRARSIRSFVELEETEFTSYPYIDTYYYGEGNCLYSSDADCDPERVYHSTSGSYDDCNSSMCCSCGCRISEDDIYYVDDDVYCRDCVVYSDEYGEYIPEDRSIRLYNDDFVYEDDQSLVCLFDGYWALKDDDDLVQIDCGSHRGEWGILGHNCSQEEHYVAD